jgi:hypothetical protein
MLNSGDHSCRSIIAGVAKTRYRCSMKVSLPKSLPIWTDTSGRSAEVREETGASLAEARERISDLACAAFERITGRSESNISPSTITACLAIDHRVRNAGICYGRPRQHFVRTADSELIRKRATICFRLDQTDHS